eukprot:TRINITY_DN75946_c0_g1_i1.p1 TRINITY_DN75946_c0_g1~~TRINITY_DN75946_c0_g1_i1.p1  ORF type:complete len:488 (-),score=78.61 TRINITY_DN75946_c0_g1_i1:204-1604(-)
MEGGTDVTLPSWLKDAFPIHPRWESLRRCCLRVDEDHGAGLDLEASEFGYSVDGVDVVPGQADELRPGSVIIEIGGAKLFGLVDEEALEHVFGRHFGAGAEVLLVDAQEIRRATVVRDSQFECPCEEPREQSEDELADVVQEHGSVVRIPLGPIDALRPQIANDSFLKDLRMFEEKTGVWVQTDTVQAIVSVVLTGEPSDVRAARLKINQLLSFYNLLPARKAEEDNKAESLEVGGTVFQSLPARNRRRRVVRSVGNEDDENAECQDTEKRPVAMTSSAPPRGKPPSELIQGPSSIRQVEGEIRQFEFMDHTADVILHSWGSNLEEALAQVCVAFYSYMSDIDAVEIKTSFDVEATGHDVLDLVYHVLDELLFAFSTELIICRRVDCLELDLTNLTARVRCHGEKFDLKKHPQGTEIKAITMHQMKVLTPESLTTEEGVIERRSSAMEGGTVKDGFAYECYVLVDI